MADSLEEKISKNQAIGMPPLSQLNLSRNEVIQLLGLHKDFRGCILDSSRLVGLDLSNCQFGPLKEEQLSDSFHFSCISAKETVFNNCNLNSSNFVGAILDGATFYGASIIGSNFMRASLAHSIFGDVEYNNGDFTLANLEGADFGDAHLNSTTFNGAILVGTDFGGAELAEADLYDTTLDNAFFSQAILRNANLCDAHGTNIMMDGAILTQAKINSATLPSIGLHKAILTGARLDSSILTNSNLRNAILDNASLREVNLTKSVCSESSFKGAVLRGSIFIDSELQYVDFSGADLRGVNFNGSNLQYANFSGADLRKASFLKSDLQYVVFDTNTRLELRNFNGALLRGIRWQNVDLASTALISFQSTGDENEARKAPFWQKPQCFAEAAEAYLSLSSALKRSGLSRTVVKYHYRAALMDEYSSLYHFLTCLLLAKRMRTRRSMDDMEGGVKKIYWGERIIRFLLSPFYLMRWVSSFLFDLIAGFGDAPWRAFISYIIIVVAFTIGYFFMSSHTGQPFNIQESAVLSITSFHGRGFTNIDLHLSDPITTLSAIEAALGALIELLFIAAFTRRFIGS